jgi:2'-5' RNA ligase
VGVRQAAATVDAFQLRLLGTGCFPDPRRPKVIWIGLAEVPSALLRLHASIEQEFFQFGFPREQRAFSPHLTIGRVKSSRNSSRLIERLATTGFESEPFWVREVVVMKSELKSSGAIHTPVERVELK